MPKSALSDRLNDPANWKGTDDDVWYMRWRINFKYLFAYGPRATERWAKWREWPKTLFAMRSKKGALRLETETWERDSARDAIVNDVVVVNKDWKMGDVSAYLSRVQYYTRWHIQLQWPLLIAFHFYFNDADVPVYGQPRPDTTNKLFYIYFGCHRDGDKVYWFPSAFIGLTWK